MHTSRASNLPVAIDAFNALDTPNVPGAIDAFTPGALDTLDAPDRTDANLTHLNKLNLSNLRYSRLPTTTNSSRIVVEI